MTYPALALVVDVPPINSKSSSIGLRARPLNRQIRMTHQRLPDVVKAVVHMLFLRLEQPVIDYSRVVVVHTRFQGECERAQMVQAMQLVEDRDVIDVALFCRLAWREVEVAWIGDEDEAITRRIERSPCFICFRCRWGGVLGIFHELNDLAGHCKSCQEESLQRQIVSTYLVEQMSIASAPCGL